MKKFIALLAVSVVAMVGAATASASKCPPPAQQFCFGGSQTVTVPGNDKLVLAIDNLLVKTGGVYKLEFVNHKLQFVLVETVTAGACVLPDAPAVTPQIDREGSCTVVGNEFENVDAVQLAQGSYVATDGSTVAIVPADFVEGVGLTCNVPAGYKYAGYDVADNFGGVTGVIDTAAPQFNFYPDYVQA